MFWGKQKTKKVMKVYQGSLVGTQKAFMRDSEKRALNGYYPISEKWEPGSYSFGDWVAALLLCFVIIGMLVLAGMMIMPARGKLVVIYEHQEKN